ncbi:MAG: hypothetical protein FWC56_06025, partial [Phycisphaerae bacterium]|nr:hypothetical protein [Phycisphaerae bacterium]
PGISGGDLNAKLTTTMRVDVLFGGSGATLGSIVIQNGNQSQTVDLSGAVTVGDILNKINGCGLDVKATINANQTGIDVYNLASGVKMSIGETGDGTAELLGIRSFQDSTTLSSLNGGVGVRKDDSLVGKADFQITTRSGSQVDVNIDGAKTIADVLAAINNAAASAGVDVVASLSATGNGITITDNTTGTGTLSITSLNGSPVIDDLGLRKVDSAGTGQIVGDDVGMVRTDSVFTALYDLYDALTGGYSSPELEQRINQAAEKIKSYMNSSIEQRGMVGARSKAVSTRLTLMDDAISSSQILLSDAKDLDYIDAVTAFQQAQTALQGNLMTGARMLQMSLLNFLS